ncbi:sugar ABC transporter permease [uncultured Sphaerochaeta sp.]|uniref:carbohydrate ABC transporter permease n=1 Tax=uncultured Sphaerochaeta sp. TaxID=886478 RepID=UPI002A0A5533|nr:sugar ABC transporter permease [uncultured Sphaerochaeta sp.]
MQAVGTRNRWIWSARILFLLPVSLLFFFFFIYPFFFTVFTSFTSWRGIGSMKFNGVKNYAKLIADPTFQKALGNNIVWALSQGLIQVPLSCLVAMILVRKPFGWRGLRTIYYLPNVISTVALAMVWVAIYNVDGPLNAILASLFGMEKHNWLGNPDTALFSVIFQTVIYIGYFMIVLLASAMNIPRSLYEAAEIDGASTLAQEINITLPMLRGTLITTMTLAMAYGMRHFEATFLMTGGGPAYATTTMGIDLYLKMDALRYSEASTSGVFLIIMGTLVITLLRKLFGSSDPMSEMAQ